MENVKQFSLFARRWSGWTLVACFLLSVLLILNTHHRFLIQRVLIRGQLTHVPQSWIQETVMPYVSDGFFQVDVHGIKAQLLKRPWVADVVVRRVWPGQVWIAVQEQQPVVRWNKKSFLNSGGDVFTPDDQHADKTLPALQGPSDKVENVFAMYRKSNQQLQPLHLHITQLQMQHDGSWVLRLNNGMLAKLGRADAQQALNRFVSVYPDLLQKRAKNVASVDLRYNHGLAVKWK
ncbi:MAG: hypothetical protein DHS20C10_02250 [marine bacterium B5-7]|nr:MAG: hypothetical protein DHS20C10_02250 [marine bacterium B5-7]